VGIDQDEETVTLQHKTQGIFTVQYTSLQNIKLASRAANAVPPPKVGDKRREERTKERQGE